MAVLIRYLICLAGVVAALITTWLVASNTAYRAGYADGQAEAVQACQKAQIQALEEVLDNTRGLIAAAHAASQALSKTISARRQADAQTTQEIRHALASTAAARTVCRFDADIMQQLDHARRRAATAAASGVRKAVSTTNGTD